MGVVRRLGVICVLLFPAAIYCVEPGHEDRNEPGVVESPGYPRPYPKESQHSWKFERPSGAWAVVFEDLDVEETKECRDDYLFIRDLVLNHELIRTCGDTLPDPVYSAGAKILISFHSDNLHEGKGFRVRVLHGSSPEALRAQLSRPATTVQTEAADTAELRLSRDDLLIYSLSLALLVAILVLICLGGWTVYHHCFRTSKAACCGCSGQKGKATSKDMIINMEPTQVPTRAMRYSKPRLKAPQPDITDNGSNNVYLPMPDHDSLDQSQSSSLPRLTRTDARGVNQLPVFHTSQPSQYEDVKFIGVM